LIRFRFHISLLSQHWHHKEFQEVVAKEEKQLEVFLLLGVNIMK